MTGRTVAGVGCWRAVTTRRIGLTHGSFQNPTASYGYPELTR